MSESEKVLWATYCPSATRIPLTSCVEDIRNEHIACYKEYVVEILPLNWPCLSNYQDEVRTE